MGNSETKHYPAPSEPKRTLAVPRVETTENLARADKPVATEEELKTVLHVKAVDFHIEENTKAHRTDKYECTTKREDDGFGTGPELVVRRGDNMTITVTFDRPFSLENDDMQIQVITGSRPELYAATHSRFVIDESGMSQYKPTEWGCKLLKKDGVKATLEIHVAADCAIGHWKFIVLTKSKVKGEQIKVFQYECPEEFTVLFNPWCKDDSVYMEKATQLDEYVLNDHGAVWRGQQYYPRGKAWNFGQFEDGILEICLHLIQKCFKPKQGYCLSDPVKVSRAIAQVVNCNDRDHGVLCGNWSGDYTDGDSPSNWYGSVRILKRYIHDKQMVKYGQCWVFSGVTTTVCRAVGLPSLSVTNFSSAHDTDESTIIEKFYRRTDEGDLESDGGDSVWNFHVWNQVWMRRPDLEEANGKYDGWQAIDATPQETSDGVFTCGPAPLAAVKEGKVSVPYDTAFVFAEVNADELYLERSHGQLRKLKTTTNKIGKSISTKIPDGKMFNTGVWSENREDITHLYKYPDNSVENRNAVMRAARGASRVSEFYTGDPEKEDVEFKLIHEAKLFLGTDVEVKLTARNLTEYARTLGNVQFRFFATKYTGETGKLMKTDMQRIDEELKPNKVYEYTCKLTVPDYMACIDNDRGLNISVFATVKQSRSRPIQHCFKSHVVTLQEPMMEVKMPESAKVGESFEASFKFKNPLDEELTECLAGYEGRGFKHVTGIKQDNIPSYGTGEVKFTMTGQKKGHFNLTFKFTSKQLNYLSGAGEITVV